MPVVPARFTIRLDDHAVEADIGFHDFEVGHPQRLLVSVAVEVDPAFFPTSDRVEDAWDYDRLRHIVAEAAQAQHYDLQETLVRRIFDAVAVLPGVTALTVSTRKPEVYPDARGVGITLSSVP